jgi:signal transduction histidine kinase
MAVPSLADWCNVDLLEADGSLRRVATVHADPAKADAVRRLAERFPTIAPTARHTAQRVLRSGQPWFDPQVAEARFVAEARSPEHLSILRELGFSGEIVVPLTSRDRALGTLTLVAGAQRPPYTQDDLVLAIELARRCALAIDNARLYAEAQEQATVHVQLNAELRALIEAEKAARVRAALLATISKALQAARLDPLAVLPVVARHTAATVGGHCIIALVDPTTHCLVPVAVEPADSRVAEATQQPLDGAPPTLAPDGTTLVVPLHVSDATIGTLGLRRAGTAEPLSDQDRELLEEIAARTALAIDNAQLHAAAQAAVAARDEFIAVAAHDLRTPIASVRGYAELALRRLTVPGEPDLERVRTSLRQVLEQSRRLSVMIDRLLDVARVEGGKVRLELADSDVADLVRRVAEAARMAHPGREVVVRATPAPAVVDPVRVEQIVMNLLDNALKFSPTTTPVEVEVDVDVAAPRGDPAFVRIAVRDHGPGIPSERRARVFERYVQAHDRSTHPGVGLGLYITRHFVELHGGSVRLESPPDGGTRFVVLLPARPPSA